MPRDCYGLRVCLSTLVLIVQNHAVTGAANPPTRYHTHTHTHTHTNTHTQLIYCSSAICPGRTTRVSRYQKGKTRKVKTNLDLLEQEIVSGSGICWAICKSAHHPRQPRQHPTTQFFTGRMPFLPLNQQRQSTEGKPYQIPIP